MIKWKVTLNEMMKNGIDLWIRDYNRDKSKDQRTYLVQNVAGIKYYNDINLVRLVDADGNPLFEIKRNEGHLSKQDYEFINDQLEKGERMLLIEEAEISRVEDEADTQKEPNWPKRWEDLKRIAGYVIDMEEQQFTHTTITEDVLKRGLRADHPNRSVAPTRLDCMTMLAYAQLRQLSRKINKGATWGKEYYMVGISALGRLNVVPTMNRDRHIVFATEEMAKFSLKNHKDLWKQYYQI